MSVVIVARHSRSPIPSIVDSSESRIQNNSKLNLTNKSLYGIFKITNRKAFMYKEEMMIFEFDIVRNSEMILHLTITLKKLLVEIMWN